MCSSDLLEKYKKEAEENAEFSEEWMNHVTTLSTLLKEIETRADEQGFSYDMDVPSLGDN